jgi:hypothetical protein
MKETYITPNIKIRTVKGVAIMAGSTTSTIDTTGGNVTNVGDGSLHNGDGSQEADSKRNIWSSDDEEN